MIDSNQLKKYIIIPTLKEYKLYSPAAVNLLYGTCAVESNCGKYIHQVKGRALGIYQMEPNTHDDIQHNYIYFRKGKKFKRLFNRHSRELVYDLKYATIMSRLFYMRIKESLPDENDIEGLARYWKKYYNTYLGKGTIEIFIEKYNKYL